MSAGAPLLTFNPAEKISMDLSSNELARATIKCTNTGADTLGRGGLRHEMHAWGWKAGRGEIVLAPAALICRCAVSVLLFLPCWVFFGVCSRVPGKTPVAFKVSERINQSLTPHS
jgi:hypothetical protein